MTSMRRLRPILAGVIFLGVSSGSGYGIWRALHSPLFTVNVVEVTPLSQTPNPESIGQTLSELIQTQAIAQLAQIKIGEENLFELPLAPIERRLMTHPWVRSVTLQKRFPQTLVVGVQFREPIAAIRTSKGVLRYLDRNGEVFGKYRSDFVADLPVVSGFDDSSESQSRVASPLRALKWIQDWEELGLQNWARLDALHWDSEKGLRIWVYSDRSPKLSRTAVDLGLLEEYPVNRLTALFQYMQSQRMNPRQISLDTGKKIVVRIAHGS